MRVLVAEDNADNRDLMARFLTRRGHDVFVVETGRAAIEQAIMRQPDVVLMDVSLPDISGLDATRRLRSDAATADMPVVAVTAHAMDGDKARCLEAGCTAYISKPVDYEALSAVLASIPVSPS